MKLYWLASSADVVPGTGYPDNILKNTISLECHRNAAHAQTVVTKP